LCYRFEPLPDAIACSSTTFPDLSTFFLILPSFAAFLPALFLIFVLFVFFVSSPLFSYLFSFFLSFLSLLSSVKFNMSETTEPKRSRSRSGSRGKGLFSDSSFRLPPEFDFSSWVFVVSLSQKLPGDNSLGLGLCSV
jgi:hypothetical protein